jgi:hypothetical protein
MLEDTRSILSLRTTGTTSRGNQWCAKMYVAEKQWRSKMKNFASTLTHLEKTELSFFFFPPSVSFFSYSFFSLMCNGKAVIILILEKKSLFYASEEGKRGIGFFELFFPYPFSCAFFPNVHVLRYREHCSAYTETLSSKP